ncbi:MAG: acyltransferase, partial [Proteobacteria bacterium]|nr:acyltransferase [Pseudomonadota bacterium]
MENALSVRPYPAHIAPLTTLRFFAALVVFIYHIGYFLPLSVRESFGILKKGYLAVDFFFILSGFILTHAYVEAARQKRFSAKEFYIRRFARIYPLHFVTLLVMAAISFTRLGYGFIFDEVERFQTIPFFNHLFLLHAWGVEPTLRFNIPSWSISAEWFAYLLFPALLLIFLRLKPARLLAASMTLFAAIWFFSYYNDSENPITRFSVNFGILRIFPEFIVGMALWLFCSQRHPYPSPRAWLGFIAFTALFLILLHYSAPAVLFIPAFSGIIVFAAELARAEDPRAAGWLGSPAGVWLGEISYAIY